MDQCTENYECLVINNNAKSNKLDEQVYWYKAASHPSFRIGANALWSHHKKFYNPDHEEVNDFKSNKKNYQKINVKKIKQ
jgi:hypothetical protein